MVEHKMDQYEKWLAALPIFQQHYATYQETQEWKWFYGMFTEATQYKDAKPAKTAVTSNIQSWVDKYINLTGPNNTCGDGLNLKTLLEEYIPYVGTKKIHKTKLKGKGILKIDNCAALKEMGDEAKQTNDLFEENNSGIAKKFKY